MATPTTLPATFVAGNVLTAAQMNDLRGAFRVLQVVSTTKTDAFTSSTVNAWTDITGMSVSITPSATTNRVLVHLHMAGSFSQPGTGNKALRLMRDSTAIGVGDAAGSRLQATTQESVSDTGSMQSLSALFLDSPSTTSATTYKVQFYNAAGGTIYVNRSASDADTVQSMRGISTITVFEVSA